MDRLKQFLKLNPTYKTAPCPQCGNPTHYTQAFLNKHGTIKCHSYPGGCGHRWNPDKGGNDG